MTSESVKQPVRSQRKVCNSCQVGDHADCDVIGRMIPGPKGLGKGWYCWCCGVAVE